jgi:hypothetical protein
MDISGLCPNKLGAYLCHDNPELRQAIFDFLKASSRQRPATRVRCPSPVGRTAAAAAAK